MRRFCVSLIGIVSLCTPSAVLAQQPPPIPGHTGTIATPQTEKDEGKAANKIIVAAEDGIEHIFPAGKGPLSDLVPGTTVVVYAESTMTEGTVTDIGGGNTEITLRYADGKQERLKLAEKEAVPPSEALKGQPKGSTRVVVYYSDAAKARIARYFTLKS